MTQTNVNGSPSTVKGGKGEKSSENNNSLIWFTISIVVAVGAIGVANNLLLRNLKDVTENLFSELATSSDPNAAEDTSSRPRVWIAGKRVSNKKK